MKIVRNICYLIISSTILFLGCAEDPKMPGNLIGADKPDLTFLEDSLDSSISATKATVYGKIVSENGADVTVKGFRWWVNGSSERLYTTDVKEGDEGVFYWNLENLSDSTEYSVMAYAVNEIGESSSDTITFSTRSGLARVKTISDNMVIRANRAVVKGEITRSGEGPVLERGILYKRTSSSAYQDSVKATGNESNLFEAEIINLTPEAEYHVMAYVKNNFGIARGQEVKITMTDGKPVITEFQQVEVTEADATFSANIVDEGDDRVVSRGFIYSTSLEGLKEGPDSVMIFVGEGAGTITQKLTALREQQAYYIVAFATNEVYGTTVSEPLSFVLRSNYPTVKTNKMEVSKSGSVKIEGELIDWGYNASANKLGVVYSTSPLPTLASGQELRADPRDRKVVVEASMLRGGTTYYARVYATNSKDSTSYGNVISITTPDLYNLETLYPGTNLTPKSFAYLSLPGIGAGSGKGYLVGGERGGESTDTFWEFDVQNLSWKPLRPLANKRSWLSLIHNGTALFSYGGLGDDHRPKNDIYFHPLDTVAKEILPNNEPPEPRYGISACYFDNAMYVIGGASEDGTVTDEVWNYSIILPFWNQGISMPEAQVKPLSFAVGNRLYVGFGQTSLESTSYSNRFFRYAADTQRWTELSPLPGSGKAIAGTVMEKTIYIVDDQGYLHKYNTIEEEWSTVSTQIPSQYRNIYSMYGLNKANDWKVYIGTGNNGGELISYDPGWDN